MTTLLAGMFLFFGTHVFAAFRTARAGLVERLGANGYRAAFSVLSGIGLVLIVMGYPFPGGDAPLFAPTAWAPRALIDAMPVVFVLLAAANMRAHLRAWLRHPMMIGIAIWALLHLLGRGTVGASVLFGGFAGYAVFSIIAAETREKPVRGWKPEWRFDLMAVAGGLVVYAVLLYLHPMLFGVDPLAYLKR
jgi:uncharacterized membrane protein